MSAADDMRALVEHARTHGTDATARDMCLAGNAGTLAERRILAQFVLGLRGHSKADFQEQPPVIVGTCRRCEMGVSLPRGGGIEGRAVELDCLAPAAEATR